MQPNLRTNMRAEHVTECSTSRSKGSGCDSATVLPKPRACLGKGRGRTSPGDPTMRRWGDLPIRRGKK